MIRPLIKKKFRKFAPVDYAPLAAAAEIMGDVRLAKKLRKKGEDELAKIKRDFGDE